jgi:hypothetical protein
MESVFQARALVVRAGVLLPALAMVLAACGTPVEATGTPLPTASPTAVPTAEASVTPTPLPSSAATPGIADVPQFLVGGQVTTNAPGLRVRSRPGTDQRVITTLGVDADLLVGMGPAFVDGFGWYLVRDADSDEPAFNEGWVSAGFEPDPFLISTSFAVEQNPYLGGYAGNSDAENGPLLLTDANIRLRWIAAPLDTDGCSFAIDLRSGSGDPVPAVRSTLGAFAAPGELFSQFFEAHPDLIGELFVTVRSDCSWALSFVRELPEPTPTPGSGG